MLRSLILAESGGGCETSFSDQQENRAQFDQLVAVLNPNRLRSQQIDIRGAPHRLHGWKIFLVDDIGADILRERLLGYAACHAALVLKVGLGQSRNTRIMYDE